jgi:mannose-1-phosphate guanylyltransferase
MYHAVIMAGGSGTRLWPLSREKRPKQTLRLVGERTLFQHAVDRLVSLFPMERILVVTREEYAGLLQQQVPELPCENFILEPEGRGTAPAIGLAAVHLARRDPQSSMAVLTADHFIADTVAFRQALSIAEQVAQAGYLVTLGIQPVFPSTGYGYIELGALLEPALLGSGMDQKVYQAVRFVEKPGLEAALQMVTGGGFVWNSGMFVWRVEDILREFEIQMPGLFAQLMAVSRAIGSREYSCVLHTTWPQVKKETIDYGVMEKAERVAVIPTSMGWVDVGSWVSLDQIHPQDDHGNVWTGPHVDIDTHNTLVITDRPHLTATIGVDGLVIVDTEDALLVCAKEREQEVRAVVNQLRQAGKVQWL